MTPAEIDTLCSRCGLLSHLESFLRGVLGRGVAHIFETYATEDGNDPDWDTAITLVRTLPEYVRAADGHAGDLVRDALMGALKALYCPGSRVKIVRSNEGLPSPFGTITEVVTGKGGYLVRPDGHTASFGWGFEELEALPPFDEGPPPPPPIWPSRFEREDAV